MDEHTVQVRKIIAEAGWAVQGVFATEPGHVNFAYTVGLTERRLPELIATGAFRIEFLATLLNAAAPLDITDDRTEVALPGSGDDAGEVVVRVRPVTAAHSTFGLGMARRMFGQHRVRAVQLLWPSDDGIYPDDAAWPLVLHGPQPLLPPRG